LVEKEMLSLLLLIVGHRFCDKFILLFLSINDLFSYPTTVETFHVPIVVSGLRVNSMSWPNCAILALNIGKKTVIQGGVVKLP